MKSQRLHPPSVRGSKEQREREETALDKAQARRCGKENPQLRGCLNTCGMGEGWRTGQGPDQPGT